jgi:hypothetical protein
MEKKSNHKTDVIKDEQDPLDFGTIYDENYESDYTIQDEVRGHYSRYFENGTVLLSSQYLEREVDSYVDCKGNG